MPCPLGNPRTRAPPLEPAEQVTWSGWRDRHLLRARLLVRFAHKTAGSCPHRFGCRDEVAGQNLPLADGAANGIGSDIT